MKPAEIDRLVATKVMGWREASEWTRAEAKKGFPFFYPAEPGEESILAYRDPECQGVYWSPSTDIRHAMEVLEGFTGYGTGKTCQVPPYQKVCDEVKYWCEVYQKEVHDQTGEDQLLTYGANNANLTMAISLAALRAKGVDV